MRIFLIGFMGVGKSFLGKELSKRLGFSFLDLDEAIAQQAGISVPEIFRLYGEAGFRELETEVLRTTHSLEKAVIATGGGAPCFHGNMQWMNENGITVYLFAEPSLLAKRLQAEKDKRPLLALIEEENLEQFIVAVLEKRQPFYELCHIKLSVFEDGFNSIVSLESYLKRFFY